MLAKISALPEQIKQYLFITGNYWAFTLTDGALRMLVVLYFHQLHYAPLEIALLFLFYEAFGVVTNLVGGWLGARIGLNKVMQIGLFLQVIALLMLTVPPNMLTIVWVMLAQALSGIAKDLNKLSAKSSIKALVPKNAQGTLYQWVAILTGSKNTLKGMGFFLGGLLLTLFGFQYAVLVMAIMLIFVVIFSRLWLKGEISTTKYKPKFKDIFAKKPALNYLAAARMCLFAARDVWFVVAIPVFLVSQFEWAHHHVGAFMAAWVIGYGIVQAYTPKIVALSVNHSHRVASFWGAVLAVVCLILFLALESRLDAEQVLIIGLSIFGVVFAINSAVHSYLIVALAKADNVSMDVGFYYMANALGRLLGTVFSGYVYQQYGLSACLFIAFLLSGAASILVLNVNTKEDKCLDY